MRSVAGLPRRHDTWTPSRLRLTLHPATRNSDNGALWNVVSGGGCRHSGLMLPARTTLAHFSISSAFTSPQSAGEPGSVHAPISANRALSVGSASPALISRFNLSTMSVGVFLGAHT